MRINQYLAAATDLSRRAADAAVTAGRVTIDGQAASLGQTVEPDARVTLDGRPVTPRTTHAYIMLNKPAGYVSSRTRQDSNPTLYELLPPDFHSLRIAGRLDRESSGLVVLSDDGPFIQELTHPSAEKTKLYELTLDQPLRPSDRAKLAAGIELTDGPSHVTVAAAHGRHVTVSLHEGRNRQLRRTFGALKYRIDRLHRTQLGPFQLGDLPSGQFVATTKAGNQA